MSAPRLFIFFFLSIVLVICFSQERPQDKQKTGYSELYKKADRVYREAEDIVNRKDYSEKEETRLNTEALAAFRNLLTEMEKNEDVNDSLLFFSYFKTGVLEHFFDNTAMAKKAYLKAIEVKQKMPSIHDSFLFRPYLYLGITLYNENNFDSALLVYKKAESLAENSSALLQESERLYNTLGALYNETGNFRQSKNYFLKAAAVLPRSNPYYDDLMLTYKSNLAFVHTRLEEYAEADKIYGELLFSAKGANRNVILHNTGILNLNLGALQKAVQYFRQVNYNNHNGSIRLFNDLALAFFNQNKKDSAAYYIRLADSLNGIENKSRKTVSYGQTLKQWGDLLLSEGKIQAAVEKYQAALSGFFNAFTNADIYKNPVEYSGVFSYIQLFNTLAAKADAFEKWYNKEKKISLLEAALDAYRSAFALADYVEKSYDSDEARLFLNKIKYVAHSKPIDISLALYDLTGIKNYLEEAWEFDQRNKASVLSLNISENEVKNKNQSPELLQDEKNIRSSITRLSLKAAQLTDSLMIIKINTEIRDKEIELGKIQEKISQTKSNNSLQAASRMPSPELIQRKILDSKTALLSYHLSEKELLILCMTKKEFIYRKLPAGNRLQADIIRLVKSLHAIGDSAAYNGDTVSNSLYSLLISPVYNHIKECKRLVIIPDDELNYLPFESLQGPDKKFLLESFSVQYQYSAALLMNTEKKVAGNGILSFAPFSLSGYDIFRRLPYSADEVAELKGKVFSDREATKENFLNSVNKYSVIHLATHARVNDKEPGQSFIAFRQQQEQDSAAQFLYASEIYNLNLDSTALVVLSACETGAGELIHGEGLLSLSRAFAYAGCPNIVTSLWKAEDKTTAYIAKQFHRYLRNGYKTDEALRKAKLDLLNDPKTDPRFKSPNYWAHLVFIGQYKKEVSVTWLWWIAGIGFFISVLLLFLKKSKPY